MRKLLNNPRFVAVLVFAALLFVGWKALRGPKVAPMPAPEQDYWAEAEVASDEPAPTGPRLTLPEALAALAVTPAVRDPFAVPVAEAAEEAGAATPAPAARVVRVRVSAVWLQGSALLAVLDGRVCSPGEAVGRCRVDDVDLDGVWLSHPGGRSHVAVGQELTYTETP